MNDWDSIIALKVAFDDELRKREATRQQNCGCARNRAHVSGDNGACR